MTEEGLVPAPAGAWSELLQTQKTLARIEGLLEGVLKGHETRFATLEAGYAVHEQRLNDKGKSIARLDERVEDLEERQKAVEADRRPRQSLIVGAIGLLLALPGFAIAFNNFLALRGSGLIP